jgi:hypothetical protein
LRNAQYPPSRAIRLRRRRILGYASLFLAAAIIVLLIDMSRPQPALPGGADGEVIYEGGRGLDAVALRSAAIQPNASGLTLTLSFTGWTARGEAVPIQSIPRLTVTRYQNPERLAVAVPDLADWSSIADLVLPAASGVRIESAYCVDRTLYWQLSGPVAVSMQGQGGSLSLTLEPASRESKPGWVVLADTADRVEYTPLYGSMTHAGFSPVRCADGVTIVLQSRRFASRDDALALERAARALYQSAGVPASVRVERFEGGRLPSADPPPDAAALLRMFGGARAEPIMRDARILAKAYDAPIYFVERANGALLTLNESGARAALPVQHVPGVRRAALSPDARYVALSTDIGDLQIVSTVTGASRILNDAAPNETERRASTTDTFGWFGNTTLAVMMGDPLRFLSVDAALPDDEPDAVRPIDPYPGVEGDMAGRPDRLFLLDDRRMLYRITPSDASRVAVGLADKFSVSPDGGAAVLMSGDERGATLTIRDLDTWGETLIGAGVPAVEVCAVDGGAVYILMSESGGYRLYRYDSRPGTMTALARVPLSRLYPAGSDNALIMNSLDADGVWSVYRISFGG